MAKKEQAQAPQAEEQAKIPQGWLPPIGTMVHYYRKPNTGVGNKLETLPALVIGYPPATSNYQNKDSAVKLKIFTEHGDPIREAMLDVTGEKKENRWSPIA